MFQLICGGMLSDSTDGYFPKEQEISDILVKLLKDQKEDMGNGELCFNVRIMCKPYFCRPHPYYVTRDDGNCCFEITFCNTAEFEQFSSLSVKNEKREKIVKEMLQCIDNFVQGLEGDYFKIETGEEVDF